MIPWLVSGGAGLVGLVVALYLRWRLERATGGLREATARANDLAHELVGIHAAVSDERARWAAQTEALRAENKQLADGMADLAARYPSLAGDYLRGVFARARASSGSGTYPALRGPTTPGVPGGGGRGR